MVLERQPLSRYCAVLSHEDGGSVQILQTDALKNYGSIGGMISAVMDSHGLYTSLTAVENLEFSIAGNSYSLLRKSMMRVPS